MITATSNHWEHSRLIVHICGVDAGLMRLDVELPHLKTIVEVEKEVTLVIPGEISPLKAIRVAGSNGRFSVFYFSADIANAGHLPAEAKACWQLPDGMECCQTIPSVSALEMVAAAKYRSVNAFDGRPSVKYAQMVGLMVLLALGSTALGVAGFLLG